MAYLKSQDGSIYPFTAELAKRPGMTPCGPEGNPEQIAQEEKPVNAKKAVRKKAATKKAVKKAVATPDKAAIPDVLDM